MKKKIIFSFATAILITVVPYIIISVYSRPSADDFAYSAEVYNVIRNGDYSLFDILKAAINTDIRYYFTWQGLYSSVVLLALQPGVFGEQYYFIGTIIMMLQMYVSIYYFVNTILKHYSINKKPFFISLCVFAVMIHGMPSTVEGLYWFNGVFNYLPFLFLTMVNIALLVKFYDYKKFKYLVLSCVLSFIISGGNHVTAFMNILILLFGLIFTLYKNNSHINLYTLTRSYLH